MALIFNKDMRLLDLLRPPQKLVLTVDEIVVRRIPEWSSNNDYNSQAVMSLDGWWRFGVSFSQEDNTKGIGSIEQGDVVLRRLGAIPEGRIIGANRVVVQVGRFPKDMVTSVAERYGAVGEVVITSQPEKCKMNGAQAGRWAILETPTSDVQGKLHRRVMRVGRTISPKI